MKYCNKCSTEKPKSDFCKQARTKDGLQSMCRACNRNYRAENKDTIKAYLIVYRSENKENLAEKSREYRSENKENIAAYQCAYIIDNAEKIAARHHAYYMDNRDSLLAQAREYQADNAEAISAKSRAYYIKNASSITAKQREYNKANPDKRAAHNRNRRAMKIAAEGTHNSADVKAIFEMQRGLCANCNAKLFKSGAKKYHVDHITPLSKGGSNWPSNLQCLCPTCNLRKNAKDPFDWAKENGKLL